MDYKGRDEYEIEKQEMEVGPIRAGLTLLAILAIIYLFVADGPNAPMWRALDRLFQ